MFLYNLVLVKSQFQAELHAAERNSFLNFYTNTSLLVYRNDNLSTILSVLENVRFVFTVSEKCKSERNIPAT